MKSPVQGWHLVVSVLALAVAPAAAQIPGPNVNMVSGTHWPGGDPFLQRQNEPACAVSTRNPLHLVCGANDYRSVDIPGLPDAVVTGDAWLGLFKSFDGGSRWQSTLLPGYPQDTSAEGLASPIRGKQAGADPVVRSAHNGLFYYSGIIFNRGSNQPGNTFVTRLIDLNNKEGASFDVVKGDDPIRYVGTVVTDIGNAGRFLDKPWIAVDVPRAGARTCNIQVKQTTIDPATGQSKVTTVTQQFPGGKVYQAYGVFLGEASTVRSQVLVTRSFDCGATWQKPTKVSEGYPINQGATIAIDPRNGTVYVAWRSFTTSSQPNAILIARSTDGGATFTKASTVTTLKPFEQGSSDVAFRTTMLPTMTIDAGGLVYVAWSERAGPSGDGRILVKRSTNGGTSWSAPVPVENPTTARGHQFMPSLTFHKGRLMLLYYEQRQDHTYGTLECESGASCDDTGDLREVRNAAGDIEDGHPERVFNACLVDVAPNDPTCASAAGFSALARRHTLDVFVAMGAPGAWPAFGSPVRVSSYAYGSVPGGTDNDSNPDAIQQLQFNPPNLPLFKLGTTPFIGDYVDIVGAPPFVRDPATGSWTFNVDSSGAAVFHTVWTDNRDVRPPPPGKTWADYTPPAVCLTPPCHSVFDPAQTVPPCNPPTPVTATTAGMRNQNIYTARVTDGLVVSALQNAKPLGMVPNPDPGNGRGSSVPMQRAFAIVVQNTTPQMRYYRLTLSAPAGVSASFIQFGPPVSQIDVGLASSSSASRTVFVTAPNSPGASITVGVTEIDEPGGNVLVGGLTGSVVLNPDPTAPNITNPNITNPNITNPNITNVEVPNPNITNPNITNPNITNPNITNPDIDNPNITNPNITNPNITNPNITNPDLKNPNITNPNITNPNITNPNITNGALTDITWTVRNEGNTGSAYDVNLLLNGQPPKDFKLQLILHKVYTTPVALGCSLTEQTQNVLVLNLTDPYFVTTPEGLGDVDLQNPNITNATVALGPGEASLITLRVLDEDPRQTVTTNTLRSPGLNQATSDPTPAEWIASGGVIPALVPQAVDTVTALRYPGSGPLPTPAPVIPLVVLTQSLPPARLALPYEQALQAVGGKPPYSWTVVAGAVPSWLTLDSGSGRLAGTPTTTTGAAFTIQVSDAAAATATRALELTVSVPFFTQVSAGAYYTCGVRDDGTVACWGQASGASTPPSDTFTQLSASGNHTCGVKSDGSVACWGDDSRGQSSPPLGTFTQVSTGGWHTCGLKDDSTVACWGDASGASTPPSDTFAQVSAGGPHNCGVKSDGTVACWGYNGYGESTPPTGTSFTQVSAGLYHTCGVRVDGPVDCWGYDGLGQSSPPPGTFTQVSGAFNHTCGLRTGGTVACWGDNYYGQSTPPAGTFTQVSAGGDHTCGVKGDGTVTCWGHNTYGESTPP
jgi:hypothetical protein